MALTTLRLAKTEDLPFIANSYIRSNRRGPDARLMAWEMYYVDYSHKLQALLDRCQVIVLCSADDPDQILGYGIGETHEGRHILHYIYVKYLFRRSGLAKMLAAALVPGLGEHWAIVTHACSRRKDFFEKHKLIYDPKQATRSPV